MVNTVLPDKKTASGTVAIPKSIIKGRIITPPPIPQRAPIIEEQKAMQKSATMGNPSPSGAYPIAGPGFLAGLS
jgi:hypothetical protein